MYNKGDAQDKTSATEQQTLYKEAKDACLRKNSKQSSESQIPLARFRTQ